MMNPCWQSEYGLPATLVGILVEHPATSGSKIHQFRSFIASIPVLRSYACPQWQVQDADISSKPQQAFIHWHWPVCCIALVPQDISCDIGCWKHGVSFDRQKPRISPTAEGQTGQTFAVKAEGCFGYLNRQTSVQCEVIDIFRNRPYLSGRNWNQQKFARNRLLLWKRM